MILYLEDWKKHPGAIPDYTTKNTSFLRLAEVYRKMGIVNCLFLLALHNPRLQGVDPFSEDLTQQQMEWILAECKFNPWYYFREIARVPVQGSPEPSLNIAHRGNIALIWSFLNGFDYANIMPRQCGKSVGADLLNNWLMQIAGTKTVIQLFTHSNKLRNANIKRLKAIRDLLPPYLNFFRPGVDADNQERLTCDLLENEYLTSVAQKDKDAADNAGRGLTSPIIQVDEGPFCPNIDISLPVALGSTGAARDFARANKTFMGNLFTTTAGKRDTKEGRFMYDLIHDGMLFREFIYDCSCRETAAQMVVAASKQGDLQDIVDDSNETEDKVLMINGTFSALQLGKSRAWLRGKIASVRGSKENAERDYLNRWSSGSDSSPLTADLLEIIREARKDPVYIETSKEGYVLEWYIPKHDIEERMRDGRYIMTIDTANMVGKDSNAMTIMDLRSMEVVASSAINEGSLYYYFEWLFNLLMKYETTTLIMENKSSAQVIFDALAAKFLAIGINPFRRMFNYIVNDRAKHHRLYQEMIQMERMGGITSHFYERCKGKFGFMTTGKARDTLYGEVFQRAAATTGHLISSTILSDQILGLVMKNNRIDHAANKHDDLVISWLFGQWFAIMANDHAFYGIPPGLVQSLVSEAGATVSEEEMERRNKQEKIMGQITALKDVLAANDSDIMAETTKLRIARLARDLDDKDHDRVMSDLIKRARDEDNENKSLKDATRKINRKQASGWY